MGNAAHGGLILTLPATPWQPGLPASCACLMMHAGSGCLVFPVMSSCSCSFVTKMQLQLVQYQYAGAPHHRAGSATNHGSPISTESMGAGCGCCGCADAVACCADGVASCRASSTIERTYNVKRAHVRTNHVKTRGLAQAWCRRTSANISAVGWLARLSCRDRHKGNTWVRGREICGGQHPPSSPRQSRR